MPRVFMRLMVAGCNDSQLNNSAGKVTKETRTANRLTLTAECRPQINLSSSARLHHKMGVF
jgi:hypothetical protein